MSRKSLSFQQAKAVWPVYPNQEFEKIMAGFLGYSHIVSFERSDV
jgi:hypothetical protein